MILFAPLGFMVGAVVGVLVTVFNIYAGPRIHNEIAARTLSVAFGAPILTAITWWWWAVFITINGSEWWVAYVEFLGLGIISGVALWLIPLGRRNSSSPYEERMAKSPAADDADKITMDALLILSTGGEKPPVEAIEGRARRVPFWRRLRNESIALCALAGLLGAVQGILVAIFMFLSSPPPFGQGGGWIYGALIGILVAIAGAVCGAVAGTCIGVAAATARFLARRGSDRSARREIAAAAGGITVAAAVISVLTFGPGSLLTVVVFVLIMLMDGPSLAAEVRAMATRLGTAR